MPATQASTVPARSGQLPHAEGTCDRLCCPGKAAQTTQRFAAVCQDLDFLPFFHNDLLGEHEWHYGQGQSQTTLDLLPGDYTLCLQAADGAHIALPGMYAMQVMTVTVQ
ncbi:MAG: DUF4399 domain-containing protein [Caldilinea sp. CFX5]|nr:DUF4399 domain-containing protein [Caldilinea sp. CFX5]